MGTNAIEDYWIDGGGSDGELRCALDGFCDMNPTAGVGIEQPYGDFGNLMQKSSRKRARNEPCTSKSKACREKMRRDMLNERFHELSSILEPGRPPKADKASILSEASRVLMQLRAEAQELKESNEKLQKEIKDLKVEKNELREEKTRLKVEKDRLEQQIKVFSVPPSGFLPHPMAFHPGAAPAAFVPQIHAAANKTAPFTGFPGMAMWQWLPPAIMDTTQDAKLWPPNA